MMAKAKHSVGETEAGREFNRHQIPCDRRELLSSAKRPRSQLF